MCYKNKNKSFFFKSIDFKINTKNRKGGKGKVKVEMFHRRCGRRITLINGKRTAVRSVTDFNHAIVFSAEKLEDDVMFEVRIDEKVCSIKNSVFVFRCVMLTLFPFVEPFMERKH